MNKLERITADAQREANRDGISLAILNLNPYSPLYVIRRWDDRYTGHRDLVKRINPHGPSDEALTELVRSALQGR